MLLQHWRANVDLQIVVDVDACARYMAKYIAKAEPRSQPATAILKTCVDRLQNTDQASSALKKAMIKVAGDRDVGAQKTAHLLLQEPLYRCTYSFVGVSLDGNRRINHEDGRHVGNEALDQSLMNLYSQRAKWEETYPGISALNFMEFATKYCISKAGLKPQSTDVVVRAFPSFSSNPAGKNYLLYCKYQLIKYKPWSDTPKNAWDGEEDSNSIFTRVYNAFLATEYAQQHVPKASVEIENAQRHHSSMEQEDETPQPAQEETCEE